MYSRYISVGAEKQFFLVSLFMFKQLYVHMYNPLRWQEQMVRSYTVLKLYIYMKNKHFLSKYAFILHTLVHMAPKEMEMVKKNEVGILFLISTNKAGILLNKELLLGTGIIFKNK